jgi:D-psicose/D-tagatose/L-ribulose 3-epimerase
MRFGAHSFLWTGEFRGQSDVFAEAAACGYDLVEIAVTDPADVDWASVAAAKQAHDLDLILCASQAPGLSLASADAGIRRQAIANITVLMHQSRDLGSDLLTGPILHPVGDFRGAPADPKAKADLIASLSALAEQAERMQMRLALEPLNRFQGYLLTRVADGMDLCGAVGSPRIGLLLDLFHMNIEEPDSLSAIKRAADLCFHIHVSACTRGIPGSDRFDWAAFRATLADIGYCGCMSVESFYFREQNARVHAHLWSEPHLSPFAAAQASLAFLRPVFA